MERDSLPAAQGANSTLDVDWGALEDRLYAETLKTILDFSVRQPEEEVSYFAFDAEPGSGYILISIDTLENSLRTARNEEEWARRKRERSLRGPDAWRTAVEVLREPRILPFSNNYWDFKFQAYREIRYDGFSPTDETPFWNHQADFARGDRRPAAGSVEAEISGRLALIFWRVSERLIAEQQFSFLRLSRPCYIGFSLAHEDPVILRALGRN
jgi:hypothetical protein